MLDYMLRYVLNFRLVSKKFYKLSLVYIGISYIPTTNKTRLSSKVFSLEKTLVLILFLKGAGFFFLGGGGRMLVKLNQPLSINHWTCEKSICQILDFY